MLAMIPGLGSILSLVPPGGWKVLAIVGALAFGVIYVDRHATNREQAKCASAALQGERDKARLERDTALDQAKRAADTVAELDRGKADAEQRARDLQLALDKAGADACRLSPDAINRLRGQRAGTSGRQR